MIPVQTSTRQEIGASNESRACEYLISKGWELLAKNFRTRLGEIDLIFKEQDGTIVFVEVKYRARSDYGESSEMINGLKQRKIVKAAHSYIKSNRLHSHFFRFDVVAISPSGLSHIPNAFSASGGYTY